MRRPHITAPSIDFVPELNPQAVIPSIEDLINAENHALYANTIINDERGQMQNEYRIVHLKLLLSSLRRKRNS